MKFGKRMSWNLTYKGISCSRNECERLERKSKGKKSESMRVDRKKLII